MINISDISYLEKELKNNFTCFHQNPELSFKEFKTAEKVCEKLKEYGVDDIHTQVNGSTGVIASIRGAGGKKTIALRADMDALPMSEKSGVDYPSKNEGVMHACGHDGHTAMLLAAARFFCENRSLIHGTIKLIFQPAEEYGKQPSGATVMMQSGLLEDVDEIFGIHLNTQLASGVVQVPEKAMGASTDSIKIRIRGKGGHGALPYLAVDPIIMTANIVTAMQTLIARENNSFSPVVLTFGGIKSSSEGDNIIPDFVDIRGTLRTFDPQVQEYMLQRIRELASDIAKAYRGSAEIEIPEGYCATINNEILAKQIYTTMKSVLPANRLQYGHFPMMGSEDFGYYLKSIPGAFYWIGCAGNYPQSLHNPAMQVDLDALKTGVASHINVALDSLN
ncbi:putative hydrolase YxeP [invertebrate metagenome]|uniref:Putative hydrolase YxeP n=1 Tax=invertebrate metagenome TaxID=1711999 RepID=A0A2H9T2I6_9ZZZZ